MQQLVYDKRQLMITSFNIQKRDQAAQRAGEQQQSASGSIDKCYNLMR